MTFTLTKEERLKSKEKRQEELEQETFSRITLSFYKYVQITDPQEMRDKLFKKFYLLNCRGRIYVAKEGINAQMNVPEDNWDEFNTYIQSLVEFNGVPYKIAVEEDRKSFIKLTIKVKDKIVADGLDDMSFDSSNTGRYLTAQEMNEYVENPEAVVVDMRNGYESEIGHFKGAITPDVDSFREELAIITDELADKKDAPIALYCTGGIRCEKASAWMKHNGFRNVRHLKGGIIDYAHQVKEQGLVNKFKGKNFVFDERLGERISDEIIATCHLCTNRKADNHYHCKNLSCHTLFIGCDVCMNKKQGYCSTRCIIFDRLPDSYKQWWMRNSFKKEHTVYKKKRMRLKS